VSSLLSLARDACIPPLSPSPGDALSWGPSKIQRQNRYAIPVFNITYQLVDEALQN